MSHHLLRVETGARLHFGLLAAQASAGRNFGGVGLIVDAPGCEVTVKRVDCDEVAAPADCAPRLSAWRDRYREHCPPENYPQACRIEAVRTLPLHCGFGSGTQTALAVAKALSLLGGEAAIAATELARRIGRGARSALGIHGFGQGGFLVEGGKRDSDDISPLVSRLDFPAEWRLLLLSPRNCRGLSGESERSAFARLGPMPATMTERLCRVTLMELLPSVAARDFATAAAALFEFGRLNGEYFSPVQGGLFADRRMADAADWLRERGCRGFGQSSWGPTLFALCRDEAEAFARRCELLAQSQFADLDCTIAAARNRGVNVVVM